MRAVSLAIATVVFLVGTSSHGADAPRSIRGLLRLSDGHFGRYEYTFNHNAIRQSIVVGDELVALTDSGNLVVFDLVTLEIMLERFCPRAAACIHSEDDQSFLTTGNCSPQRKPTRSPTAPAASK